MMGEGKYMHLLKSALMQCLVAISILIGLMIQTVFASDSTQGFERAAKQNFKIPHRKTGDLDHVGQRFEPNFNFPVVKPDTTRLPWSSTNPIEKPDVFMKQVFDYARKDCGKPQIDWNGVLCGWFHAPWLHDLREPLHGLTRERSSRLGELHPSQTKRYSNFAISLYNDVGGYAFHKIWSDPARPKSNGFAFDSGAVSIKLLFTSATPEDVPYLRHSKIWEVFDGEKVILVRLIQLDIAVKDDRLVDTDQTDLTGWAFGTFLFNGSIELEPRCPDAYCESQRWMQRMVPVGLQWGNDPQLYAAGSGVTGVPSQAWINPTVARMFENIRTTSGHPSYLGRDGRLNGPVDNHRSTCMACHARSVDFGKHEENPLQFIPFSPKDDANNQELRSYFRNLNSNEPFVPGTQSMDYSLQASIGLRNFRSWVDDQKISAELKAETRDFDPTYDLPSANRIQKSLADDQIRLRRVFDRNQ